MSSNDKNSKDDIRSQLSDMQRRLFSKKSSHNALRESTSSNSSQLLPEHTLSQHHDQENAFAPSLQPGRRPGGELGLPAVKRSKKGEKSHPSLPLGAESKGNDMNFVVGLSENLLTECRRLNADNTKLKSKLKQALQDVETLKEETLRLSNANQSYSTNESELKDKNWQLESQISSLKNDLQLLEKSNDKLKVLQEDMNSKLNDITRNNDELDITNSLLSKKLKDMETKYEKDIRELSQRVESLNDENDILQSKVATTLPMVKDMNAIGRSETPKQTSTDIETSSDVYVSGLESILKELEQTKNMSLDSKNLTVDNAISQLKIFLSGIPSRGTNTPSTNQVQSTPSTPERRKETSVRSFCNERQADSETGNLSELSPNGGAGWDQFLGQNIESTPSKSKFGEATLQPVDIEEANRSYNLGASIEDSPITGIKHAVCFENTYSEEDLFKLIKNLPKNNVHDAKIKALAEGRGMKLMSTSEYQDLVDEVDAVKSNHEGTIAISETRLQELDQKAKSYDQPDIKYITDHAKLLGFVLIDDDAYKELNNLAKTPSIDYIAQRAKEHNKSLISNKELQLLVNPNEEQIRKKAEKLDLKVLSKSEVASSKAPSLSTVKELALKHDHVIIPSEEHNTTREMISSPTLDYLRKHLKTHELTPMSNEDVQDLLEKAKNPSIDEVKHQANKKGLTTLTKEEHEELSSLAHDPSIEHLEQSAKERGYSLVEKQSLETLKKMSSDPPVSHIRNVASKNNMSVLPLTEYNELERLSNDPDLEHIREVASKIGYSVLSNDDFEELKHKVEDPSIEQLESAAEKKSYKVVSNDDYQSIVKRANDPDLEHIKQVSDRHSHRVVETAEFKNIERRANEPTIEEIKSNASRMGMVVVDQKEYQKMSHPTSEDLRSHCERMDLHLCSQSEFNELCDKLENPKLDYLMCGAEMHGYSLVDDKELNALRKSTNEPDLAHLEEKAHKIHYVVVPEDKFESMERQISNPSVDELQSLAQLIGSVVLDKSEYSKLTNPSRDMLEKNVSTFGYSMITTSEMERLKQLENEPSKEFLVSRASNRNLVVVPKEEYDELSVKANNPSKEHLAQKAKDIGFVAIPRQDHETSRSQLDNPTIDFLRDKARLYDQELISSSTLTQLQNTVSRPSLEYLDEKARDHKATVVDAKEYSRLVESEASPNIERIKDKALKNGYDIVQLDELAELRRISDDPKVDDVSRMAAALDLVVLSESEHTELSRSIESPTIEYLNEHADKLNFTMVESQVYDDLKAFVESPSKEFITEKAHSAGLAAVPEEEYLVLCHKANDPDLDELMAQAKSKKMTLININELEKLHSQIDSPNTEYLSEHAEKVGSVMIPKEELTAMKQQIESPTNEYLKTQCDKHKLAVLPESELAKLRSTVESPSVDFLSEKAEAKDYKVIKNADYSDMVKKIENPDIEYLKKHAADHEAVLITRSEYNSLAEPDKSTMEAKASALGFVVMAQSDFENMRKSLETPDLDYLNTKSKLLGHELISSDQLASLHTSIDNPSQDYLNQKAASVGSAIVGKAELDHLRASVEAKELKTFTSTTTESNRDAGESSKMEESTQDGDVEEQQLKQLSQELLVTDDNEAAVNKMKTYLNGHGYTIIPVTNTRSSSNSTDLNEDDAKYSFEVIRNQQPRKNEDETTEYGHHPLRTISENTIANAANSYSLSLVPDSEYISLKKDRVNKERLENRIKEISAKLNELEYDLVERKDVIRSLENDISQIEWSVSKKHIRSCAKNLGLLCISATYYVGTTTHPRPDVDHVKILPASYFNQLLKYKSSSVEKISDDTFDQFAKKRGYVKKDLETLDVTSVQSGGGVNEKVRHPDGHSLIRSASPDGTHAPPMAHLQRHIPHSSSLRSNLSEFSTTSLRSNGMFSMATDVSFTDKSMIPAITQVVIGEYLFKYYRRFGSAFSAIAETRHERYFWVHPYSLTLYWSESNPVLSNPASRKTRAAAIVDVDSVNDNNPIPTGLYHKSIIVHSTDRALKITCATRQRHNIWYNALRYLIHRNIDDLSVDEEAEDNDGIEASTISHLMEFPKSGSHRNLEALKDTGDRRVFPRPKRVTSQEGIQTPRTPGGVSRLSSFRRS
ncbi:Num1 protein [Candida orthopsilosis Co 90-125]|uniref:Num1 protein n=1 Tax=Candida orthopsilosis (strain 90-125) TaxID=1136231 RepID=H8X781_CANO9|nr:Num1 protein [Candida orthopsilosis Co 90-125]CCG24009.1 Num1 protein [Candida orthopsilosis Co 90-125]